MIPIPLRCPSPVAAGALLAALLFAPAAHADPLSISTTLQCPPACLVRILNMDANIDPGWLEEEARRLEGPVERLRVEVDVRAGEVELHLGGLRLDEEWQVEAADGVLAYEVPVDASEALVLSLATLSDVTPDVDIRIEGVANPRE